MHPAAWDGRIPCHPFPAARMVWVEVPKAASTTIKVALANHLLGADFQDDVGLHDFVGYSWAAGLGDLERRLAGPWRGWLRVTVVRDPIDRFASLYRQKIDPHGYGSLDAWVQANADSFWWDDIHAQPQTRIVGDPGWYDLVGRVEELPAFGAELSRRLGTRIRFGRYNVTQPGDPPSPDSLAFLTRRYADDLAAFRYRRG